jgi:hypothetical protein
MDEVDSELFREIRVYFVINHSIVLVGYYSLPLVELLG